jgi:methylthioribose-1-phosphate isomerase
MVVRGAPLIGAAAAYGMALAMKADPSDESLAHAYDLLVQSRPTNPCSPRREQFSASSSAIERASR